MEFLPDEAKDIHAECKGSPMVISMIGGLISESGRHSQRQRQSGRWGYYLTSLKSRRFSKYFIFVSFFQTYRSFCMNTDKKMINYDTKNGYDMISN